MIAGQVIFFNAKVGWGLISGPEDTYFVHYKDIEGPEKFKTLRQCQDVLFEIIGSNKKHKQAIKVIPQ